MGTRSTLLRLDASFTMAKGKLFLHVCARPSTCKPVRPQARTHARTRTRSACAHMPVCTRPPHRLTCSQARSLIYPHARMHGHTARTHARTHAHTGTRHGTARHGTARHGTARADKMKRALCVQGVHSCMHARLPARTVCKHACANARAC